MGIDSSVESEIIHAFLVLILPYDPPIDMSKKRDVDWLPNCSINSLRPRRTVHVNVYIIHMVHTS